MKNLLLLALTLLARRSMKIMFNLPKRPLKHILNGVLLNAVGYLMGFITMIFLLIGCFFYLSHISNQWYAALGTALPPLAAGVALKIYGDRLLRHPE